MVTQSSNDKSVMFDVLVINVLNDTPTPFKKIKQLDFERSEASVARYVMSM
jgi:hypothetical protein